MRATRTSSVRGGAEKLAADKGLIANQIALAWVLNSPLNVFPLVGARSEEEFTQNEAALDLKLTPQEMAWLNLE